MKYRCLLCVIVFAYLPALLYSQSNPSEIVTSFFEKFQSEGILPALDFIYNTNPWVQRNQDAVVNLKNEMSNLTEDYVGKIYGYDKITEKWISDRFVLQSYLVRYDRQPLRFTFQFYQPNDTWRLYSFQYDSQLSAELEESAKIFYLPERP